MKLVKTVGRTRNMETLRQIVFSFELRTERFDPRPRDPSHGAKALTPRRSACNMGISSGVMHLGISSETYPLAIAVYTFSYGNP